MTEEEFKYDLERCKTVAERNALIEKAEVEWCVWNDYEQRDELPARYEKLVFGDYDDGGQ